MATNEKNDYNDDDDDVDDNDEADPFLLLRSLLNAISCPHNVLATGSQSFLLIITSFSYETDGDDDDDDDDDVMSWWWLKGLHHILSDPKQGGHKSAQEQG